MQLAFYKARYGNYIDKTINLATGRLGFSHVEAVFDDIPWSVFSRCFSASHRDGGVRFKGIILDDHWEVLDLGLSPMEPQIKVWCNEECGKPYDLHGALLSATDFESWTKYSGRRQRGKWFCSEICSVLISIDPRWSFVYDPNISPNELYTEVMQWKQRQSKMNPSSATK